MSAVEQVIQASWDSGHGFQEAAADVTEAPLAQLFRRWSVERFDQAEQLCNALGASTTSISRQTPGAAWLDGWRRVWMSVRGALNAGDRTAVLRELERAENLVGQALERTMRESQDSQLTPVLEKQLQNSRETQGTLHRLQTAEAANPSIPAGRIPATPRMLLPGSVPLTA